MSEHGSTVLPEARALEGASDGATSGRLHPQRLLVLVGGVIVVAGFVVPWTDAFYNWCTGFDRCLLQLPLFAFAGTVLLTALFDGDWTSPAPRGAITFLSLVVISCCTLLVCSPDVAGPYWAWPHEGGPFISLAGGLFVLISGLKVGQRERPRLATRLSRGGRR